MLEQFLRFGWTATGTEVHMYVVLYVGDPYAVRTLCGRQVDGEASADDVLGRGRVCWKCRQSAGMA